MRCKDAGSGRSRGYGRDRGRRSAPLQRGRAAQGFTLSRAPNTAEHFLRQAGFCDGRSPLYASLCRRFAADPRVLELVDDPPWDFPLRFLAGLHFLVLEGRASWDDVDGAVEEEREFLVRFVQERVVQTNEVQRAWALLPAFLTLVDGRPLEVLELGPSAGLNLVWDRYRYGYSTGEWGSGPLLLSGDDRVPPPAELLATGVSVVRRRGVDLRPVDVTTDEGARLLESFVWADQAARIERLQTAISILREDPPELVAGDYVAALPELLADRVPGAQLIVFETASTQYLSRDEHERLRESMHHAGRDEPFVYLTTRSAPEEDGYSLKAIDWPSGDERVIVRLDFHGAWLDYRG
jgi:hypothetical protein